MNPNQQLLPTPVALFGHSLLLLPAPMGGGGVHRAVVRSVFSLLKSSPLVGKAVLVWYPVGTRLNEVV